MDSFIKGFIYGYSNISIIVNIFGLVALGLVVYAVFVRYHRK